MVPNIYKPDWLLEPPPRNPYLIKDNFVYEPNFIDTALNKIYYLTYDRYNSDYKKYINREKEFSLLNSNDHIKKIRSEIKESNKKLIDENENVKKLENKNENNHIDIDRNDIKI